MKLLLAALAIVLLATTGKGQSKLDSIKTMPTADSIKFSIDSIRGTLAGPVDLTYTTFPKMYAINWAKVKTFADLKLIMQTFNFYITENAKNFKKIKKYLIISK